MPLVAKWRDKRVNDGKGNAPHAAIPSLLVLFQHQLVRFAALLRMKLCESWAWVGQTQAKH